MLKTFGELVDTTSGKLTAIVNFKYIEGKLGKERKDYSKPILGMLETDAAKLTEGATVTVRGTNYKVAKKPLPDGGGMAQVFLISSGKGQAWQSKL